MKIWIVGLMPAALAAATVQAEDAATSRLSPPPAASASERLSVTALQPSLEDGGALNLMCATNTQGSTDQINLRLQGAEGELSMPRAMLPLIRRGHDGRFKLSNVQIKPNEITASVSINPFNNPTLRLDRSTGSISIQGKVSDYSGQCRRSDPATMQRRS